MNLKLQKFEGLNPFQENAYLVHDNKKAHLFDPGFHNAEEWDRLLQYLESVKLDVEALVITHAHVDHIMGLQRAMQLFEVPLYMHKDSYIFIEQYPRQAMMFGMNAEPLEVDPVFIDASWTLQIGSFEYDSRHTPGHSPGHLSFYHKNGGWVIAGDALFAGSIGRTDLFGGDYELLEESIKKKLYTLPDDTVVWPGHGPNTTIGYEKKTNPFVKGL
ncbi:MBL fold metallo-hydrolase [Natronogracilivirga saccharolytica]|uniref:MBL fold metallo-hydrolase n=1 Tax=Natronogracilivirga saccharolytica TaxID=2812953 RepID=A0A8J7UU78_9BACT|nr:MBL fold metallo-hydrolase [Natronogracilivirga saccharolytica]MBP3191191.1 MBL fold metallo-hydrolase [Natronogracilivirga saccharolytica]